MQSERYCLKSETSLTPELDPQSDALTQTWSKQVKKQESVEPDYEYPFPSYVSKIKQLFYSALTSAIFGNKIKVNFQITSEICYEIDIHFEFLKFLDGHHSANFVYVRKFVEN